MPAQASPKEQYHHFIPRFVLRRFQVEGHTVLSKKERSKAFRKRGFYPEYVSFYSLDTGVLDQRAIHTVYGESDLYKDVRQIENVYQVEKDLSKLECQAARVITELHDSLPTGSFRLKRKDLNQLRKFMFIMHYRMPMLSATYFSEDHPQNGPAREWIETYRKAHHLESSADMWLHVLRYYLETPHHKILLDAQETMNKHGGNLEYHLKMPFKGVDPRDEHHQAVAYDKQANGSYLGIWQAAEGDEFILSHNSFGLWEGTMGGQPEIHRLFVVSPTVLVVLRTNFLRPEAYTDGQIPAELLKSVNSDLVDIITDPPLPKYSDDRNVLWLSPEELNQYRATKLALNDVFDFKISKLTSAQTYAVNRVIMANVRPTGSITFVSKKLMSRTLRAYLHDPYSVFLNAPYAPLVKHLDPTTPVSPHSSISLPAYQEAHEIIDVPLFTMLIEIVTGVAAYQSRFHRAFAVLDHLKRNKALATELLSELHFLLSLLRVSFIIGGMGMEASPFRRRTHAEAAVILNRNPRHVYEQLFCNIFRWGVNSGFGHASDPLTMLRDEVVVVAFIDWAFRRHPSIYQSLLDGSHPLFQQQPSRDDTASTKSEDTTVREGIAQSINPSSGSSGKTPGGCQASHLTGNADALLKAYLSQVKNGQVKFRSKYDRALAIYGRATGSENMTNSFSLEIRRAVSDLTDCIVSVSKPPASGSPPKPPMALVNSCSCQNSDRFFFVMSAVAEKVGYLPRNVGEEGLNILNAMFSEAVLVGLASSLARQQPDFIMCLFQKVDLQLLE